ncbi:MAG TPA: VCBS repeat-containing protein [Planctomycetota bacterium]|nr:VCBS repeat-containing protein [Planctomycetota bacterium]
MGGKAWVAALAAAGILCVAAVLILRSKPTTPHALAPPVSDRPAIDPVTDHDRVEEAQSKAGGFLKKAISAPLLKGDTGPILTYLTPDFRGRFPGLEDGKRLDEDGLVITDFAGISLPETVANLFITRLKVLLGRFLSITRCQFRCYTFLLDKGEKRARGLYHWWLSGTGPSNARLEVQGDFAVDFEGPPDSWKISRIEFPAGAGQLVESTRPTFANISDPTGFEFAFSEEGRRALQSAIDNRTMTNVGGLAAVDWNHDGFPDLIATNESRRSVVFVNDGKGGFTPEALPEEGALFYLYLDLDGDGIEELVSTQPAWYRGDKACLGLYTRKDGTWIFKESLVFDNPSTARELLFHHVTAADVDGDGRLDLFVSAYSNSESGGQAFNFMNAQTGQRNLLFMNKGGLKFSEEAEARGIRGTRYHYVAEFFDLDNDGDLDLLVINDFGPDNLYWNQGDGRFIEDPHHPIIREPAFGMGLAIADFDNEGKYSVYVSNMYSHAGNRMLAVSPKLRDDVKHALLFSVQGNALYEPPDWKETAAARGIARADWSWGCVFFDLDNDADKDLFVANGFTTHSDPTAPDY